MGICSRRFSTGQVVCVASSLFVAALFGGKPAMMAGADAGHYRVG